MMDVSRRTNLRAQAAELAGILEQLPADDWMTRPSFEVRLQRVRAELESTAGVEGFVEAWLDFDGDPVRDARGGLLVPFAATALANFQRALEYVGASCVHGLASSGPPVRREDYVLALTDTSSGSFRFKLEAPGVQGVLSEIETPLAVAVGRFRRLLASSIAEESIYVQSVSDLDVRALNAVGDFLRDVSMAGAVCGFEYAGEKFSFESVNQVVLAAGRMEPEIMDDVETIIMGRINGYLPESKWVEIVVMEDSDDVPVAIGAVVRAVVVAGAAEGFDFRRTSEDVDVLVSLSVRHFAGRRNSYRVTGCRLVDSSDSG